MRTLSEKLASLNGNDLWIFTKQSTDFDDAFKATKLFSEIRDLEHTNVENYFADNFARYGISTDRHRVLIIAQMFGLLTKTPIYSRGTEYSDEKPTEIFGLLNKCVIGDYNYNTIKSEQILKFRIKQITDSGNLRNDFAILPLLYSYFVLAKLKNEHQVVDISNEAFFTYVATCKSFNEIDECVDLLLKKGPTTPLYVSYKDSSRVVPLLSGNSKLIIFDDNKVWINPKFEGYFNTNFIQKHTTEEIIANIKNVSDYAYFLNNYQNFNVNLIDEPPLDFAYLEDEMKSLVAEGPDEDPYFTEEDIGYNLKVDTLKEENINPKIADLAYLNPLVTSQLSAHSKIKTNPYFGKIAIIKSDYCCCANEKHQTFISKRSGKPYMEAHHLIPIKAALSVMNDFHINVDCVENIVSLCPNCHRAVHLSSKETKKILLTKLFDSKKSDFQKMSLPIQLDDLFKMYNCL